MQGFFSRSELEETTRINFRIGENPNCADCGLYRKCRTPKMGYTGKGELKALIIAEAPGAEEDDLGKQLVGRAGRFLRDSLRKFDLDLDRDFWKINAVNCRPHEAGANRTPTPAEIRYCLPNVLATINELQPEYIILFGGTAVESLYADKLTQDNDYSINRWRGLSIPDRRFKAFIMPTYHPSYLVREDKDYTLQSMFKRDLEKIARKIKAKTKFPEQDNPFDKCISLTDYPTLIEKLDEIINNPPEFMSFDYETTGKKPYRTGHKIACISFSTDGETAYSFPYQYRNFWKQEELFQIKRRWRKILREKRIKKTSHNLKFEQVWSKVVIGTRVRNWYWDTMNNSHIMDNRPHFTGLDFQVLINFGLLPYNKDIKKYLESRGSGNNFNNVDDAPLPNLLTYSSMDSLMGFRLFDFQLKYFAKRKKMHEAIELFRQGALEFAEMEMNGIRADEEYYERMTNRNNRRIERTLETLFATDEARQYETQFGKRINPNSNKELGVLYNDILGLDMPKNEDTENIVVDKHSIEKIDNEFTKNLLIYKKFSKVSKYLAQFKRELYDGTLHPFFGLNVVISFRGQSNEPNFQNIPKRDEQSKNITRGGLFPSKGNKILEFDFGGIEVCTSACYHHDPNMIKYITDPSTDMHRDNAFDIWRINPDDWFKYPKSLTKRVRYYVKNGWTFPQFYGDWFGSCAEALWETSIDLPLTENLTIRQNLRNKNIISLEQFKEHCKKVEDKFWNVRFKVYNEWRKRIVKEFQNKGYISSYIGFEFRAYMDRKQNTNFQIQGTAFHILLKTIIEVSKIARRDGWKSRFIGQIHDAGVIDLDPDEEDMVIRTIQEVGTKLIRKMYPWIIVPLTIEFEMTKVDEPWSKIQEFVEQECECGYHWAYKYDKHTECSRCQTELKLAA